MKKYINEKILKYDTYFILFISFLAGLYIFYFKFGFGALNPENNNWLLSSDIGQSYMGWNFFRNESWTLPLGNIENYFYPHGSNIAYTDSIPLLAIFFKIFSNWLPVGFQYLGIWFLSCFILQMFFAQKLFETLKINDIVFRTVSSIIILLCPALLFRVGHPSLFAHWLIIASFWNYYRIESSKSKLKLQFVFVNLSALIHPYLLFIIISLSMAFLLREIYNSEKTEWINLLKYFIFSLISPVFILYITGYFTIGVNSMKDYGPGLWTSNLNTFYNPLDYSNYLKPLKTAFFQQYEGFGYLGFGVLIIIAVLIICKKYWGNNLLSESKPIIWIAFILFLLALSFKITFYETVLLEFHISGKIETFFGIFRSSGRFVWVLDYLIIVFALYGLYNLKIESKLKVSILILACFIQINDIKGLLNKESNISLPYTYSFWKGIKGEYLSGLNEDKWLKLMQNSDGVLMYPPLQRDYYREFDYLKFSYLAYLSKKPFSAGAVARFNPELKNYFTNQIQQQVINGHLHSNRSLYITTVQYLNDFINLLQKKEVFAVKLDNYIAIFPTSNTILMQKTGYDSNKIQIESLETFFNKYKDKTILISISDEATNSLDIHSKAILNQTGIPINDLHYRGSMAAIIYKGKVIKQSINNNSSVKIEISKGEFSEQIFKNHSISLESAGNPWGNFSKMKIDGVEMSPNKRGMNIIVLDDNAIPIEIICFDTYASSKLVRIKE